MKNTEFTCTECGEKTPKWKGQCGACKKWDTLVEIDKENKKSTKNTGYSGTAANAEIVKLTDINEDSYTRFSTGLNELDRVLGGDGVVNGAVTLIGGDPGVGKSTILLQVLSYISEKSKALYISGEESPGQIKMRAERLKIDYSQLNFLAETNVEKIIQKLTEFSPEVIVIDSIQTIYSESSGSSPGSTSQVKECTSLLNSYAKQNNISMFSIGHVTKDGTIAGPKVLEHIVDTVLYFEGEQGSKYRIIRSIKNRFGEINEIGVFAMMETGIKEIKNPSAIFLSNHDKETIGSSLMVTKEGTRPLLIEIQSLLSKNPSDNVRRMSIGVERDRLILMLAILQRKAKIKLFEFDVYVSIIGGVKVTETSIDVPLVMSILSSYHEKIIPKSTISFGEIGLTGEVRPVPNGEERIKEAIKHGIKRIIIPKSNLPKKGSNFYEKLEIIGVDDITDIMKLV